MKSIASCQSNSQRELREVRRRHWKQICKYIYIFFKYNKIEGNKNPAILSTWPVKANWNTQWHKEQPPVASEHRCRWKRHRRTSFRLFLLWFPRSKLLWTQKLKSLQPRTQSYTNGSPVKAWNRSEYSCLVCPLLCYLLLLLSLSSCIGRRQFLSKTLV